jgi:TIR domain
VQRTKVFVSYSRHDEAFVRPLAGLLGVAANDAVFLDVASIKPGDNWKDEIDGALRESSVFIICWCCQAEKSQFIAHEIALAVEGKDKRLVPVLFCDTPLPTTLSAYQWVDLRGQITHSCQHVAPNIPRTAPAQMMSAAMYSSRPRKKYLLTFGSLAAMLLIGMFAIELLPRKAAPPPVAIEQPTRSAPKNGVEPEFERRKSRIPEKNDLGKNNAEQRGFSIIPIVVGVVLLLFAGLYWIVRRDMHRRKAEEVAAAARAYFNRLGKTQAS